MSWAPCMHAHAPPLCSSWPLRDYQNDTCFPQADLAARLVAHGQAKEAEAKPAAKAVAAKEDAFGPIEDDDSDSPDDVPQDISFAAARQAAIAAEAAEADATARLARKRRKRPRTTTAKGAAKAAGGDDSDSDDDLDDDLIAAAAEVEAEEKAAARDDDYSSDEEGAPGSKRVAAGSATGSGKPVVVRALGRPKQTRGPERDELGRHIMFGDRDDAAEAMAQANVASAAGFLQSHFYGDRLNRQSKPRVGGGRKLGAARGFGTGGDGAKQVRGKQSRRRK